MKVQFTRPHVGGAMSGIGTDTLIIEQPDTQSVPPGGTQIAETTPVQEWTWNLSANTSGGFPPGGTTPANTATASIASGAQNTTGSES